MPRLRFRVKHRRLERFLQPAGYVLGFRDRITKESLFVRRSVVPDCFERIRLWTFKDREVVRPRIEVSIAPVTVDQCSATRSTDLEVVSGAKDRCTIRLRSDDEALAFERQLADIAPNRNREFALQVGPVILEATTAGRKAAEYYLRFIPDEIPDPRPLYLALKEQATAKQVQRAENIMISFVPWNPDDETDSTVPMYDLGRIACYTMVLHEEEAIRDGIFAATAEFVATPRYKRDQLTCDACLQVMQTKMARTPGWNLIEPNR